MKQLITGLMAICLCAASFAQNVNIVFRGNQSKNYRVMIDGKRYRSFDATTIGDNNYYYNSNAGPARMLSVTSLMPGTHRIDVYSTTNANDYRGGQLVYTNNFQLRTGYDMNVTINGNRITFNERENGNAYANGSYRTAMTSANFAQTLNRIRSTRYQDARISAIRSAIGSTDYFTTDQISQMLTLVNGEDARLDLAKAAWTVTADPSNYYQLNGLFNNQAYVATLNDYVRAHPVGTANEVSVGTSGRVLMSGYEYNRLLRNLNDNSYQSGKYNLIRDAFSNSSNAFTADQVRQLLATVNSESDRLYLAKLSYPTVTDQANFNTLLSLFDSPANRADLNTYIINNGGIGSNVNVYRNRVPMQDYAFNDLLRRASNHILPMDKYNDVKNAFTNTDNYYTSYQAKQLISVIGTGFFTASESDRIALAKLAYDRVTDPANFSEVINLFDRQSSRDELNSYIRIQSRY